MGDGPSLTCPATLEDVRALAAFVCDRCEAVGVPEHIRIDVELALVEAANNVVLHGYASGDVGEPTLTVIVSRTVHGVEVVLEDRGKSIPGGLSAGLGQVPIEAECGRGLSLILALTDRADYASCDGRNRLTLFKALRQPAA